MTPYQETIQACQALSTVENLLLEGAFYGKEAENVLKSIKFIRTLFQQTEKSLETFPEHRVQK